MLLKRAFEGELVLQDLDDKPVEMSLKRLCKDSKVLEFEKRLPDGWISTKLKHISRQINPGFASGKHNSDKQGIPHIRPMNIDYSGNIDLSIIKYVKKNSKDTLQKNDVLFNNTNSPKLLGKTALIKKDTKWAYSNHMTRIRLDNQIVNSTWIAIFLHKLFLDGFYKQIAKNHVNQSSINSTDLATKIPIVVPPLLEQKRIVSKIESIFTQIDIIEEVLKSVQFRIAQYRQVVLKMAFEGKLVPQDPNDKPVNKLLETIWGITYERVGADKRSKTLPQSWIKAILGQTVTLSKEKVKPENFNGRKYVGLEHIAPNTYVLTNYGNSSDVRSTKSLFNKRDILYGRLRPYLNKVCIPDFDGICSTDILVLKPRECIIPLFLCLYLKTMNFVQFATNMSHGVNLPRVKFSTIEQYWIPIPPYNEQKRIISKMEYIFAQIETIERYTTDQLRRLEALRNSILKQAFEGRLIPQDPNDEPAGKLLERIRSAKHDQ